MRKTLLLLTILTPPLITSMQTAAYAQINHTWVASNGADGNTCDRAAPCATFAGAYNKAFTGGEVSCVDPGNYGGLGISKSITINCEAAIGSNTTPSNGNAGGFNISTVSGDVVILRGLDIDGDGGGGSGLISFTGAGTLRIEKSRISSLHGTANGITFTPSGSAKLQVSDSFFTNNGGSGLHAGIYIAPSAGLATVMIERTAVDNNTFGIFADGTAGGTIRGTVADSIVSGNSQNGISVNTNGVNVGLLVDNTKVSGNNYGLAVGGTNGLILVRRSSITANNTGLSAAGGGSLVTYKDNTVNNNTSDGAFSFAIPTQ